MDEATKTAVWIACVMVCSFLACMAGRNLGYQEGLRDLSKTVSCLLRAGRFTWRVSNEDEVNAGQEQIDEETDM